MLEDMLRRVRAGRMPSIIVIAEEVGRDQPHYCIAGRFRAAPAKAIGHLAVMKQKVTDYAADLTPDLEEGELP